MNRIIQMTKKENQDLKQENSNLKNNLSAQKQSVESEGRQLKLRTCQARNEHFKNKRKNNNNNALTLFTNT